MLENPFGEEPIPEIHLSEAPLVDVVAQLRFPAIASIGNQDFIAPFQDAVRDTYPIMRQEHQITVVVSPEGVTQQPQGQVWRLSGVDDGWSIALAPNFVAIEAKHYTSRDDFFTRWERVVTALAELATPAVIDRIGVRYVDRLEGANALEDLANLVRPEVYGALAIGQPPGGEFVASISVAHFRLDGLEMQTRWGRVPEGTAIPGVDPVDGPSWFLDVDAYVDKQQPFAVPTVMETSLYAADHAYRFFRWTVTQEFLRRFGGQL